MKCKRCKQTAVIEQPPFCREHFTDYVETTIAETIKRFNFFKPEDRIVVAASGGKDSLTVLSVLQKQGYALTALAIDEGIHGYREKTIKDLALFCTQQNIPLHISSYQEEFGSSLDEILKKHKLNPCTVCGVFRRYLLNKKSRELGATKLVTGHNLDDEAQAIMMNLIKHNTEVLPRIGPITGVVRYPKFVPRVKPLYLLTEKQIMTYAFLHKLTTSFVECPNTQTSFRNSLRDKLNDLELEYPESKKNIVLQFLTWLPSLKQKSVAELNRLGALGTGQPLACNTCGEPSLHERCHACVYIDQLGLRGAQTCHSPMF